MTQDRKIVLASNNAGKAREINQLLRETNITIIPQSEYQLEEIEETGLTFVENALIKARHAARQTKRAAIADDSGLEALALNGQPGIYSARYAGKGASDKDNLEKLIQAVAPLPEVKRQARFVCVMVFLQHADDPTPIITSGVWNGLLITEPRGENGFGYDPIFYLPDRRCTSAELAPEVKNRLSHRGQALRLLTMQLGKAGFD